MPPGYRSGSGREKRQGESRTDGTMHSKFAVFDRQYALVGSFNLDPRSARLNSESAVVFENTKLAGRLADIMLSRDLGYSKRISEAAAETFEAPQDAIYRFRKSLGDVFEKEL
ncbi:phospholipase D-like domain-containing protein [Thiolapillus sp.]|uniref:phospholipase D-like domain-containing protein n=1 Tax=Thiolapillus sp. TaxID=2017437 RepID=UPI0025F69F02|nr:phospholipase D-like domain-containing protein [Thiolapillus sp.]